MRRLIALVGLCLSFASQADERILSFHSDVQVFEDGIIEVTETIKVRSEGKQIRRGIYSIPTGPGLGIDLDEAFVERYRVDR